MHLFGQLKKQLCHFCSWILTSVCCVFKNCGKSLEQVITDSDLRGGCLHIRNVLRSCREYFGMFDRPRRAVVDSTPNVRVRERGTGGRGKMHNVEGNL